MSRGAPPKAQRSTEGSPAGRDKAPPAAPRKVSVHDVAREAGVSIGSVSRVLNGGRYTSNDLVARVTAAARKLGYQPDAKAQSLRSGTTRTVGCLVTDITNPFYASCVSAIETRLAADGFMLLLACSHYDAARENELIQLFGARGMDGIIVATMSDGDTPVSEVLRSVRVPLVVLDRDFELDADFMLIDHRAGVGAAVKYLADLGHSRIALFTPGMGLRPARERVAGYMEAHKAARLPVDKRLVRSISNQVHSTYDDMRELLALPQPPTAVIGLSHRIVSGALRAIHEAGLKVPADISLVSIGSGETAEWMWPPMTQVRFDVEANGRTAAEVLLERLRHPEAARRKVTLSTQLVIGGSCAPPRAGRKAAR